MFSSLWLHQWLGSPRSRKDRRRRASRQRRGVRPMLETLEDRLTPSTVIENAPDAAMLQTDLTGATAANTQYVINLTGANSAYNLTAGQQLTVSAVGLGSSVTVAGTGQSITGNGNRVFLVDQGANVTLENLTITGGSTVASGGGIYDSGGNVTLSNVTVQGNTATGNIAKGGGIFVSESGNLTIEGGSVIRSNQVIGQVLPPYSNYVYGGGVYVSGASTVTILDSILSNNSAQGAEGGSASGGGLYAGGTGWTATLMGDTFSGNSAVGGNGGNAAPAQNATGTNAQGSNGGFGGYGGEASGGAAVFTDNGSANTRLTILDDPAAPIGHPSLFLDNFVQSGNGGAGGAGGPSTGDANNSFGGGGGSGGYASGGAIVVRGALFLPPGEASPAGSEGGLSFTANIGNTTFFGNKVSSGNGAAGGAAGSGGSGNPGGAGQNLWGGDASGGGLALSGGAITLIDDTVANNSITPGLGYGGARNGEALGGGIDVGSGVTLDNNTITQNILNGTANYGSGIWVDDGYPTLINNLIQGNQSIGSSALELDTGNFSLSNVNNNFIASVNSQAGVSTTTNIVGNTQVQLGGVVGVTSDGKPSGGPIYYPLLPNTVSIGAGSTSVLNFIAGIEGTTADNATDEIDNPRSTNGSIDLGAVQLRNSENSSAPVITSNPTDQSVTAGSNVSFTASAVGTPTPTVQWKVSVDGGKTFSSISGAAATLTLNNVTTAMNGYEYQAIFTNSAGSNPTNVATLTVNPAVASKPYITSNPSSQTATAGTTVSFTASAGGTPMPTVQWQVSRFGGQFFEDISGATTNTLTLNNVAASMNNELFRAVFTNSDGTIITRIARLTVNAAVSPPPSPPPALNVPPLLSFLDSLLGGIETVNANGTETITDRFFGIPLLVSTFDASGNLMSVDLLGFNITFLFLKN